LLYSWPRMAGTIRLRSAWLALAVIGLFSGVPARAQDQDQEDTGVQNPTPAESLGVSARDGSVLGQLGIRPAYNSQVEVNKTSFLWNQGFAVNRTVPRLKLENSWNVGISKNSAQNHYKSRAGDAKARGEYNIGRLGGWSTGADLGLKRVFSGSDFNRTVDNGNDFSWFLTAGAPGALLSRLLRLPEGALSWDFTGTTGATENVDIRDNRTQGGTGQRSDSTHVTGSTAQLDTRISAISGLKWKLDVTGRIDRDRQSSRTRQSDTSVSGTAATIVAAENENRTKRASFTTAWTPSSKDRIGLTGQYSQSVNQSYSADVRAQDTKTGLDQRIGIDMKLVPFWGINLDLKADNNRTDIKYELSTQGRGSAKKSANGRMNFIVGQRVPLLRGTEVTTEGSWEKSKNTFQSSTSDYNNDVTTLRQVLRRPLGTRFVAVTTGEASISRMLYDDKKQDRDDLRFLLDGALGYRPRTGFDCRLTGSWRQQKTVYIPAANSRNSLTAKSYGVGAELGLQVTPAVKVTQTYKMTADYSFYDFNESSNILSRTTEVRTGLQATLGQKAKLGLDHSYRFKDSGRYVRDFPGAPRLYAKASGETYQFLTLTTRYDFTPGFAIRASQGMEVRDLRLRGNPAPPPTRTTKLQFTGGLDLNHKFSEDFTVNSRVERTQSSAEKSYWRVSGALNRVF
jgi:hypothetical protein